MLAPTQYEKKIQFFFFVFFRFTFFFDKTSRFRTQIYHVLGNHELYNFSVEEAVKQLKVVIENSLICLLKKRLDSNSNTILFSQMSGEYYTFKKDGFVFIGLNAYDVSMLGRKEVCL